MPSPLAHLAAGWLIGHSSGAPLAALPRGPRPRRRTAVTLSMLLSLLPDFDVIPGFLIGDLGRWHNQATHSVAAALLVSGAAWLLARAFRPAQTRFWGRLVLGVMLAHLGMDYFTLGRGLMLAWPFSLERFRSPWLIFYGLHYSDGWWSVRHVWTLLNEASVGAVAAALWYGTLGRRALRPLDPYGREG